MMVANTRMRDKLLSAVQLLLLIPMTTATVHNAQTKGEEIVESYRENWNDAVDWTLGDGEVLPHPTERETIEYIDEHRKEILSDADITSLKGMVAADDSQTVGVVYKKDVVSDDRNKRAVHENTLLRWNFGIVPYIYTPSITKALHNEIRRAQLTYERFTCMRFVPWTKINGETTNERLNLGHVNYLRHAVADGCRAVLGNMHRNGQPISCCYGKACIHEMGHAMGLFHEQDSPDPARNWIIRMYNNQKAISPETAQAIVGYDITSLMHYTGGMGGTGNRPLFTKLFPELEEYSGYYYMMMEVSLAHECHKLNCSTSSLICENDGYLTTVDDKCACRCVPGLDPDKECKTTISSTTRTQAFPGGSYALPEPKSGCPETSMSTGSRIHYNDGGNSVSSRFDIHGKISGSEIEQRFCIVENSISKDIWPPGNYCIYRKGGTCPKDFSEGFVQYDDNSHGGINTSTGDLPDGVYGSNTRFEYCCRNNGFTWEPIYLPNRKPFVLFRNDEWGSCQQVRGMHAYDQHYEITNSDDDGIAGHGGDDDPLSKVTKTKFRTNFCYYEPAMIDCGGVIDLTEEISTATITSPVGSELECTWFIKTNENAQIRLQFDSFDIKGTMPSHCQDTLKIRYFRPGQKPFTYCGNNMNQTIQSVNNTIVLQLSTHGQSDSSFSATANLIFDKNLCYDTSDRGMSYVGNVNFTRFFEPCLPWIEATKCKYNPLTVLTNKARTTVLDGNYCRNPEFATGITPWCYTNVDKCERNYCDPCLITNKYDTRKDCKPKADLGLCSFPGSSSEAMKHCAKTCKIKTPATPGKARDVTCPRPPPVMDGSIVDGGDQESYSVGSKIIYKCQNSHSSGERMCLTSGEWSDMGFVCDVCPFQWYMDQSTKHCLKYFEKKKYLSDARQACKDIGGSMAAANNEVNNSLIKHIMEDKVWLPISHNIEEDKWYWDDNSFANWINWAKGQPDNWGTGEHCATMKTNGEWNDVPCSYAYPYVCTMPFAKTVVCKDYWDECPMLYASKPTMCTDNNDFAHRMCPYTCGICNLDSTPQCAADTAPLNGKTSTNMASVSRGAVVRYSCDKGYVAGSGNDVRGCMADGTLSGDPLVCANECPAGWVYMESNKQCYGYFDELVDYATASSRCKNIQGNLAMPVTPNESNNITEAVNSHEYVWVGLNDRVKEGVFMWDNGEFLLNWENWDWFQPDNWKNSEDCIYIKPNGKWNDVSCNGKMKYVCQVSVQRVMLQCDVEAPLPNVVSSVNDATVSHLATVRYSCVDGYVPVSGDTTRTCLVNGKLSGASLTCVPDCPDGWVISGRSMQCYKFFKKLANYTTAKSICEKEKGTLPTPKTEHENKQLMKAIKVDYYYVWIGLDDRAVEDTFKWADGKSLKGWTNWDRWEPNDFGSGEDCVHLGSGGKWNDAQCSKRYLYACQVPLKLF